MMIFQEYYVKRVKVYEKECNKLDKKTLIVFVTKKLSIYKLGILNYINTHKLYYRINIDSYISALFCT